MQTESSIELSIQILLPLHTQHSGLFTWTVLLQMSNVLVQRAHLQMWHSTFKPAAFGNEVSVRRTDLTGQHGCALMVPPLHANKQNSST